MDFWEYGCDLGSGGVKIGRRRVWRKTFPKVGRSVHQMGSQNEAARSL